jgi:hypothetical protein
MFSKRWRRAWIAQDHTLRATTGRKREGDDVNAWDAGSAVVPTSVHAPGRGTVRPCSTDGIRTSPVPATLTRMTERSTSPAGCSRHVARHVRHHDVASRGRSRATSSRHGHPSTIGCCHHTRQAVQPSRRVHDHGAVRATSAGRS